MLTLEEYRTWRELNIIKRSIKKNTIARKHYWRINKTFSTPNFSSLFSHRRLWQRQRPWGDHQVLWPQLRQRLHFPHGLERATDVDQGEGRAVVVCAHWWGVWASGVELLSNHDGWVRANRVSFMTFDVINYLTGSNNFTDNLALKKLILRLIKSKENLILS